MKRPHDEMTHKTRYDNYKKSCRRYTVAFADSTLPFGEYGFFDDAPDFAVNLLQRLEDLSYFADWTRPADVLRSIAEEVLNSDIPINLIRRLTILLCEDDYISCDTYRVVGKYPVMSFYCN